MCFDDDDYSYESRLEVRNGQRYYTEDYYPRFGMSRRRRYGFGGSYYPSRYYDHAPRGRYMSRAVTYPNRYPQHGGGYPRGVVPGGYSRGVVPGGHSQAMVPRGFVGGSYPGYPGYSSGYNVGARSVMPVNSAIVSSCLSFLAPIALVRACNLLHRCLTPPSLVRMMSSTSRGSRTLLPRHHLLFDLVDLTSTFTTFLISPGPTITSRFQPTTIVIFLLHRSIVIVIARSTIDRQSLQWRHTQSPATNTSTTPVTANVVSSPMPAKLRMAPRPPAS
jgi:hypothetical protein